MPANESKWHGSGYTVSGDAMKTSFSISIYLFMALFAFLVHLFVLFLFVHVIDRRFAAHAYIFLRTPRAPIIYPLSARTGGISTVSPAMCACWKRARLISCLLCQHEDGDARKQW